MTTTKQQQRTNSTDVPMQSTVGGGAFLCGCFFQLVFASAFSEAALRMGSQKMKPEEAAIDAFVCEKRRNQDKVFVIVQFVRVRPVSHRAQSTKKSSPALARK